jgi:hypothetical protein
MWTRIWRLMALATVVVALAAAGAALAALAVGTGGSRRAPAATFDVEAVGSPSPSGAETERASLFRGHGSSD